MERQIGEKVKIILPITDADLLKRLIQSTVDSSANPAVSRMCEKILKQMLEQVI